MLGFKNFCNRSQSFNKLLHKGLMIRRGLRSHFHRCGLEFCKIFQNVDLQ